MTQTTKPPRWRHVRLELAATAAFSTLIAVACAEVDTSLLTSCEMAPENRRFLADAIGSWKVVSTQHLQLDESPLPRIVVFGIRCQWDLLAGEDGNSELYLDDRSLPTSSRRHEGEIHLPNGTIQPLNGVAFA